MKGWINQIFNPGLEGKIFCSFILRKEWKIVPSKPVLSVWFSLPSTYFYHTIKFTTIYHFNSRLMCVCVCIYIYIYTHIHTHVCINKFPTLWWKKYLFFNMISFIIFNNPSAGAGYDSRTIFKQRLTGLNSAFSFS